MTAPRPNLKTRRTVSLNHSPGFRGCEKLAVKVTHNVTVVEYPAIQARKSPFWSTIACFVILYLCELHPSNRPRDCAHHPLALSRLPSVCISLSPVTLPAAALGLVRGSLNMFAVHVRLLCGIGVPTTTCRRDRPFHQSKNAASGTMCATKNLVCVPNSRRRTAESKITMLLSF